MVGGTTPTGPDISDHLTGRVARGDLPLTPVQIPYSLIVLFRRDQPSPTPSSTYRPTPRSQLFTKWSGRDEDRLGASRSTTHDPLHRLLTRSCCPTLNSINIRQDNDDRVENLLPHVSKVRRLSGVIVSFNPGKPLEVRGPSQGSDP